MNTIPHAMIEHYAGTRVKFYTNPSKEELDFLKQTFKRDPSSGLWYLPNVREPFAAADEQEVRELLTLRWTLIRNTGEVLDMRKAA